MHCVSYNFCSGRMLTGFASGPTALREPTTSWRSRPWP